MRDLRINAEDAVRAAEQRALRLILIARGEGEEARRMALAGEHGSFKLNEEELQLELYLKLMWLDGASTVAKAMLTHPDAWKQ